MVWSILCRWKPWKPRSFVPLQFVTRCNWFYRPIRYTLIKALSTRAFSCALNENDCHFPVSKHLVTSTSHNVWCAPIISYQLFQFCVYTHISSQLCHQRYRVRSNWIVWLRSIQLLYFPIGNYIINIKIKTERYQTLSFCTHLYNFILYFKVLKALINMWYSHLQNVNLKL